MGYKVYDFSYIETFDFSVYEIVRQKKEIYYNVCISFDIETSSFFINKKTHKTENIYEYEKKIKKNPKYENEVEKSCLCYIWQVAIEDCIFIGRKLEEFRFFIEKIKEKLNDIKIIIYVHNLSYEFQFIRKYIKWSKVFAIDNRKVLYCETDNIVFRCSYLLSNKSLLKLCDDIIHTDIKKLVGDLDYKLLRTSETLLTKNELEYCYNDVLIVTAYIKEQLNKYKTIPNIPLTQTGKVRRYVRDKTKKNKNYYSMIHKSLILTPVEFKMARFAFQGGYTHANSLYTGLECVNVASFDITSSYPTCMMSEFFPMSKGCRKVNLNQKDYEKYITKYCSIASIEIYNFSVKKELSAIISSSKCLKKENIVIDNGRVNRGDYILIIVTDVDYKNILRFYDCEKIKIGIAFFYKKSYLPKEIIECVLLFYKNKTTLKGIKDKEYEYLLSKEMLNSLYGMCVYNPIKTQYIYNKKWITNEKYINQDTINEYNNDKGRFLFYLWGVFITAYGRNNLYEALLNLKSDYIYCDTDSVKIFHAEKYQDFFENYNEKITKKLNDCCNFYNIPTSELLPMNNKGDIKKMGIWDFEGAYTRFKTLGAKRYMTEKDNKIEITVSGLNKKTSVDYLYSKYETNDNIFKAFNHCLYIPREHTGKKTHTYIDEKHEGIVTDYKGYSYKYKTLSGIHLFESDYELSIADNYLQFFKSLQFYNNII